MPAGKARRKMEKKKGELEERLGRRGRWWRGRSGCFGEEGWIGEDGAED